MSLESDSELIGRVLDLQKVQILRCRAALPMMDGAWLMRSDPLSVLAEDGKRVGFSLIRIHRNAIEAELFISWDTAERLDIQEGKKMYLGPGLVYNLYGGPDSTTFFGHSLGDLRLKSYQDKYSTPVETGPLLESDL